MRLLKSKILLFVLIFCIAFPVVFTEILAVDNLDHDHAETDCSPCHQIEIALFFLNTLRLAGIFLFLAVQVALLLQIAEKNSRELFYPCFSITRKVRFNC